MKNMDWNDLSYCLAIIDEGSVTAAAKSLGVNHTTVSRRITALESQLGAPLFDRSNAGWSITPLGETILPEAKQMRESAQAISRMVTADRTELSGSIRVTTIDAFIQSVISVGLKGFTELYPEIDLELITGTEILDLASHDADIAFRHTDSPPPNVVGTQVGHLAFTAYCTREVLAQMEQDPEKVYGISWLSSDTNLPDWMSNYMPQTRLRYRANSVNVLYDLSRNGFGVGYLPCALGDISPLLVRVPTVPVEKGLGLWVLSHVDLRTTARIRIFRDFMVEHMENLKPLFEGERENYWKGQPKSDFMAPIGKESA